MGDQNIGIIEQVYYLQVSLESSPPLNLILEPSLQMTPQPKAEYTDLPLELRETLSQYLDIKTLIALGACDPYILKRTFTKHLLQTTFKKTHLSETTRTNNQTNTHTHEH